MAGSKIQQNEYFKRKNVILRTQNIVNYFSKIGGTSASNCDFVKVIIFVRGSNCDSVLVGTCHHGMACPQVADRGTASDKEGSCE